MVIFRKEMEVVKGIGRMVKVLEYFQTMLKSAKIYNYIRYPAIFIG